jgi:cell division protein FtsZ
LQKKRKKQIIICHRRDGASALDRSDYNIRKYQKEDPLADFVRQNKRQQPVKQPVTKKPLGKTNCFVMGVGGGGNNTISRLMAIGIPEAYCICINTDLQHLQSVNCDSTLLIGKKTTRGLGAGGKPTLGRAAAEESMHEIDRLVSEADVVFLTCGLGGGTGTGSIPLIAEAAKKHDAIVISVVTIPFTIEGSRKEKAYLGLEELRKHSDTVVVIENDQLLEIAPNLPIQEAFSVADEVLANYIYSIITTVSQPGLINVDFADLRTIITHGGVTVCGIGEAISGNKAEEAVNRALDNPLINVNYSYGTAALIHVTGGSTMSLQEASSVVEIIRKRLQPGAEVIWGTKVDPEIGDLLRITVVISGVQSDQILGKNDNPLPLRRNLSGGYSLPAQQNPTTRAKENWLKKETRPSIFKEIRKRAQEQQKKTPQKSSVNKEEKTDDFWEELGLEKGLK